MQSSITGELITLLTILGAIITTLAKTFRFVHEGELGIKLRFGRALRDKHTKKPRIIEPGFVMLIPFAESLRTHHVRQRTINLANQKLMIAGGLTFEVGAVIIFRVKDIYRSLFEIDNLEESLSDLGMGILRDVFAKKEFTELEDTKAISAEMLGEIEARSEEWGLSIIRFSLTDCAPTAESGHLVNAVTGARLKCQALQEVAKEMGIGMIELNSALGAVLVGMPLQATTSQHFEGGNGAPEDPVLQKLEQMRNSVERLTTKLS